MIASAGSILIVPPRPPDLKALACEPAVDEGFLFYALLMQRDHIRELATEASHGTKKLETPVLAGLPILVPPPGVQHGCSVRLSSP